MKSQFDEENFLFIYEWIFFIIIIKSGYKMDIIWISTDSFLKYVYSHLKGQSLRQFHLNYTAYFHMY